MSEEVRRSGLWLSMAVVVVVVVVAATASWKEVEGIVKIAWPRAAAMRDSGLVVFPAGDFGDGVWGRRNVLKPEGLFPVSWTVAEGGWKPRVS